MPSSEGSSRKESDFETKNSAEFQKLKEKLRDAVKSKCQPLPDEPDFFTNELILTEFLRARKYDLNASTKMLTEAVEWRREYRPLKADCTYCHENPGFHCIRQVGFDSSGRPIIYSNFSQASAAKNSPADTIMHCVQMLENVRRSFKGSATKIVMVIDCSGMTLPCCNPNLGRQVMHVFADFYPERLGRAVVVNHKAIFQQIWRAIKRFLDPVTASKMTFIKLKNLSEGLREFCDESTAKWLEEEIRMNREMTEAQMRFWEKPSGGAHDPRGTDEYIRDYVDCPKPPNGFQPHPNIVDMQRGKLGKGHPVQIKNSSKFGDKRADAKQIKEYGLDEAEEGDDEFD